MPYANALKQLPPDLQTPMLEVLEAFRHDLYEDIGVRRKDFDRLTAAVAELAEAQKRTEQRVAELAEAQKRTEERVSRLETAVTELAEAQKRTEERVSRLETTVAELIEAQKRTEERLTRLEKIVAELIEAQKRTEERLTRLEKIVAELIEAQKRTEQRVTELAEAQKRTEEALSKLTIRVGTISGKVWLADYREKAYAYFGGLLRRVKVISLQDLESVLEERLTDAEMNALRPLDLLVRGQLRKADKPGDLFLAVEASAVVDANDVARAQHRATLLRKAGYRAIPVAAGEEATEGAQAAARQQAVLLLQDGLTYNWEEALADALAA